MRLAALDEPALGVATQALHKLLGGEHAYARRLDGEHLDGLAATLPLGGTAPTAPGYRPGAASPSDALDGLELPVGSAGLMLGSNRHGAPVIARLFRPEQTRAADDRRACAVPSWWPCARWRSAPGWWCRRPGRRLGSRSSAGAAVPGESIAVVPPGRTAEIAPGTALHPLLVVVDVGPVGPDTRTGHGWQATLVVRDEFTPADVDLAARADLLLLQPLRADEAALAGSALGLGDAAQWLTRIREDMVGRGQPPGGTLGRAVATPIELQLIGPPARS